jgi:histidine ammonia-lyase
MLIRANQLALGLSGVRPEVVETLLEMLARGVVPVVPSQGSLGASGDLAPLAHLALVMCRAEGREDPPAASGRAWFDGRLVSGAEAMRLAGIARLVLAPKEGLALTNAASFSTAITCLACADARRLTRAALAAAAVSYDALMGASGALNADYHLARGHPGQIRAAARLRDLLEGSTLLDAGDQLQDAYSLRCTPQVVGPALEVLEFVEAIVARELNAATDNPLILDGQAVSGGNFHGEPIGLAADYLKVALAEVGAVSERRTFRLLSPHVNAGLPAMLVPPEAPLGLHSGLMMLQYTAASLVLENAGLAAPDSVRSLPTSADQEDHNANAATAARHLAEVAENLRTILAIEFLAAVQALDLRLRQMPSRQPGRGVGAAREALRRRVPFLDRDRPLEPDIRSVAELLRDDEFLGEIEASSRGVAA